MNKTPNHQPPSPIDLIVRYLDGYATESEKEQLNEWVEKSADNKAEFESYQTIWMHSADAALLKDIDVEADLAKMKTHPCLQRAKPQAKRISLWPWGIAAGIALLVAAFFLVQDYSSSDSIRLLTLADGSKVWLNQSATLSHPKRFEGEQRIVELDGEAYFEIARNAKKPFLIKANGTEIKVLGTSFNVQSFAQQTEVTVTSGSVQFGDMAGDKAPVILSPNERGTADKHSLRKEVNPNPNFLAWKTGVFHFKDTELSQVVFDLSRYYRESVKISANQDIDCQLTADFKQEKLKTILEAIRHSCGLTVQKTEGVIWLKNEE